MLPIDGICDSYLTFQDFEAFTKPSKRKSSSVRHELPGKKIKKEVVISQLTKEIERLKEEKKNYEDERMGMRIELDHVKYQLFEERKKKEEEEKKSGIYISIHTTDERISWFKTKDQKIHQKLWNELSSYLHIPKNSSSLKYNAGLLLDLLFFTFSTGLSFETLSRSFFVNGEIVSSKSLSSWFDKTLDELLPWAKKQIYLLQPEEWCSDS